MDFTDTFFALIDIRSFSSLWYWIVLAVAWSMAAHFAMGLPYDLVSRYRRAPELGEDLIAAGAMSARRLQHFGRRKAMLTAFWWCLASFLAVSGFYYGAELAQAVFLLLVPLSFVFIMAQRHAARLLAHAEKRDAGAIAELIHRIRFRIQLLGMVVIFCTAIWGMLINLLTQTVRLW